MYKPIITDGSNKFGNNRWLSYSSKLKRDVYLFSDLEYEHWLLIESNPKIMEFCEQALLMQVYLNGKVQSSIIDMWVKYENGHEEFIEIKYKSDLKKEKVVNQIAIQKAWCEEHGYDHNIRTEEDIRSNRLLLSNIKLLVKSNKIQKDIIEIDRFKILKILNQRKSKKIQISALIQETQIPSNRILKSIGQMILKGEIFSDISQNNYGINTEVWLNA